MLNKSTVFIVDDDEVMREFLQVLVQSTTYNVISFDSAKSFLEYYLPEMPGCLLLDINMPEISGIELKMRLTQQNINIPTIFVSATASVSESVKAFKVGAFDFIEKANVQTQLISVVQKAITHDRNNRCLEQRKLDTVVKQYAESIVETVRQPLLLMDDKLNIVLANQYAQSMFNVNNDNNFQISPGLIENTFWQIPQLQEKFIQVLNEGIEIRDLEVTNSFNTIGRKTLLINARQLIQNTEKEKRVLIAIEDISRRKQIEHALYQEKEQALITLHSIGEGVITANEHGFVEYMNPVAEKLTGWRQVKATGLHIQTIMRFCDEMHQAINKNPVTESLVKRKTVQFSENICLINRKNKKLSVELISSIKRNAKKQVTGVVVVFKDVTEQRKLAKELVHQAAHDELTGLVNRREFEKRLERSISSAKQYRSSHVLCYLDLDQFKIVNDTAGHKAGDELLQQISTIIREGVRCRDTLARIGGDEFGLILENCPMEKAKEIITELIDSVRAYRFIWRGDMFSIGLSVGMIDIAENLGSADQLMSRADVACYTAKEMGRNQSYIYSEENSESAEHYSNLLRAAGLTRALEEEKFRLYCQPIFAIQNGKPRVANYEILVRLLDDNNELVMPGSFIPAAERYGLMSKVDRWVIKNAFQQYNTHSKNNRAVKIAINLSGNSLNDEKLLEFVEEQLAINRVPTSAVCFEITETAVIHNINQAQNFINSLKAKGCRFALDDFGSGLSSLAYLQKLPVDYLKIDGSFVKDILSNPVNHAMVVAINEIGRIMGLNIVAEYAESHAVVEALQNIGIDYAQGFGLQSPIPFENIMQ